MKTIACVLFVISTSVADLPQYRQVRYQPQTFRNDAETEPALYPAAGYRPAIEFQLPTRQEPSLSSNYNTQTAPSGDVSTMYGIPTNSYEAPSYTYIAPESEYGIPTKDSVNTKDAGNNSEQQLIIKEANKENLEQLEVKERDAETISDEGAYYVLLPGSQLQKIQFRTENDIRNMAFTARLQYKSEDRAPIFVYNPTPQYQTSAAYIQLAKV